MVKKSEDLGAYWRLVIIVCHIFIVCYGMNSRVLYFFPVKANKYVCSASRSGSPQKFTWHCWLSYDANGPLLIFCFFSREVILWFMKSQTLLSASEQMSLCYDIINMIDMMKSNKSMWWDADLDPGNAELTVVIYFQGMTDWKLHIWPTASSIHHHHHRSLRGNEADTGLIVGGG